MTRQFSIYLDGIRFCAAMAVFLTHLSLNTNFSVGIAGRFGHDAVVLFFVLSGYVIAHTVDRRDHDIGSYAINRLARLWSVVLPALLLTVCLDSIRTRIAPAHYHTLGIPADYSVLPVLANALFVNQLWFLNISPWSNTPFWSLGFEFWYYVFFACIAFSRGWMCTFLAVASAMIMGPKILLMLPIWLLGVAIHARRNAPRESLGWLLFAGSILGYLGYRWITVSQEVSEAVVDALGIKRGDLGMAAYFPSDYVVALLCAANFYGLRGIERRIEPILLAGERPIRFLAGFTFSLYLYHVPLLDLLTTILPSASPFTPLLALFLIFLIGTVTERKKHVLRRALARIVDLGAQLHARLSDGVRP
jgi:peptidoglycan/LPS O-acetylase OafA/YrhL